MSNRLAIARRRLENGALILMLLRLLDHEVQHSEIPDKERPLKSPDATEWLNLLAKCFHGDHPEAKDIARGIRKESSKLLEALREEQEESAAAILRVRVATPVIPPGRWLKRWSRLWDASRGKTVWVFSLHCDDRRA